LYISVFACSVLCAADFGHGATSVLTRAGLMAGPSASYPHTAVIPTLLVALIFAAIAGLNIGGEALARAAGVRGDWLAHVAARISGLSPVRLAPVVFAGQLLVLFAMESAEQIAALGHPLGFLASFGAPLAFALAINALAALITVFAISYASRCLTAALRALAIAMAPMMRRLPASRPAGVNVRRLSLDARSDIVRTSPLAWRVANRPPPLRATAAL
jgi:hypothetical protein